MSLSPAVSLVEAGPEDAPNPLMDFIQTQEEVNFVNDEVVIDAEMGHKYTARAYAERFIWEVIVRCKQRRMPLEADWLAIQRMIVKKHDTNQKYKGNSQAYVPVYKRNRRTLVSTLSRGLFPSDDFMDVVDREQGENEAAKVTKMVIQYEFEHSGLRQAIKGFLGQYVDFGVSVLKVLFRKDIVTKGVIPSKESPAGLYQEHCEGLEVVQKSMFNLVVYPESADSKKQLQLEAERMEVPTSYVTKMKRLKRWENVDEALMSHGSTDDFDWVNQATLNDVAQIPGTLELRDHEGSLVESVIIVEAWCRMVCPAKCYGPGEDPQDPLPVRVVFVNGVAVQIRRNPFHHQTSPFLYARDNQVIGSFYSDGAGADTQAFQYLANDHFNQLNDCMTFGMMPMWMVNTNYMAGPMDSQRPGRVFKVRDIDKAIKPLEPNINMVQYGQTHTMNVVAMGQDASGAPPVLQGTKGAPTATGSQILQNNAQGPLQDQVEDIEADVMVNMMSMTWALSRQFRTVEFIRKIGEKPLMAMQPDPMTGIPAMMPVIDPATGKPKMVNDMVAFLPSEVNIDPQFRFLSSSQAQNRQLRQQGLTLFADLALKLAPNLQAQGKMLNPEPILQRAWSDGLGNRGFDKVIIPMPMMPMMPGAPGGQGGMPGQPPPVGAVPQGNVPGAANNEPAQGEGDVLPSIMDAAQAGNAEAGKLNLAKRQPDTIPF